MDTTKLRFTGLELLSCSSYRQRSSRWDCVESNEKWRPLMGGH